MIVEKKGFATSNEYKGVKPGPGSRNLAAGPQFKKEKTVKSFQTLGGDHAHKIHHFTAQKKT